ncbi:MAG: FeoB-associated Cys-rich membrane protein [Ruminococcaceae bacterium]|nr:FeoB-associated Cys-rich membrane protein [Oscillospiraceae bacterium]
MEWFNLPTLIVTILIAAVLYAIVFTWFRNRKKGKSSFSCSCGGNCASCGMNCSHH